MSVPIFIGCAMLCFIFAWIAVEFGQFSENRFKFKSDGNKSCNCVAGVVHLTPPSSKPEVATCDQVMNIDRRAYSAMPARTSDFRHRLPSFQAAVDRATAGRFVVGHVMLSARKSTNLHYLAQLPFVRTVCETGFNAGHSSFNFLTASPVVVVHSFDAGYLGYTRRMARYLKQTFRARFHFHLGDAKTQIKSFLRANPDFRCDLIFVDGDHGFVNVFSDLALLARVASDPNIIIADGSTTLGIQLAWSKLRNNSVVEEIHCSFKGLPDFRDVDLIAGRVQKQYAMNYTVPTTEDLQQFWNNVTVIRES